MFGIVRAFLLIAVLGGGFTPMSAMAQTGDSAEIVFWNSVKDSKSPAEIKAYLDRYPQGTFATLAKLRYEALLPAAVPQPQPAITQGPWGAIAFAAAGAYGMVWGRNTKEEAEAQALTMCVNNRGRNCKTGVTQACGALAVYNTRSRRQRQFGGFTAGADTLGKAIEAALLRCRNEGPDANSCNIRASFCADGSHKS
jgi:hypothetical protein